MTMGPLGFPELVTIFLIFALWLLPVIAGIWALFTLQRLRTGQQAMAVKIDHIERMVQARHTP
jgi:hypothetical protein